MTSLLVSAGILTLLSLFTLLMPGSVVVAASWFYRAQFLVSVVLVCRWFHLAVRHGIARGAGLDGLSAGEAVRSWFIPYLNFWRPFALLRELFESASVQARLLTVWQLTWIASSVGHVMLLIGRERFDLTGLLIFYGVSVVAALSGALTIRALKWR